MNKSRLHQTKKLLFMLGAANVLVLSGTAVAHADTTDSGNKATVNTVVKLSDLQKNNANVPVNVLNPEKVQTPLVVVTNEDTVAKPSLETNLPNPEKYKDDIPVQILGINDLHGGLNTTGNATIGANSYKNAGTVGRLASYLNEAEKVFKDANPNGTSIRVEAGDMVGGSPAYSALLQDESTMHALKAMGFEVGTLGNHEFDEGLAEFMRILHGGQPIKEYNKAEMEYPHEPTTGLNIITANVVNKSDGKIPFGIQPYYIKELKTPDGKTTKIGFIGIETTDLPILTLYDNYKDYNVLDEAETIAKYSKILREQGVNAIVVLAHTGISTGKDGDTDGTAVQILNKLNKIDPDNSVDIYVAGHSHQYANATVGNTHVVQAIYTGKAYDDIIGYISPKTNDFVPGSIVSHVYPVLSAKDDAQTPTDANVQAITDDAIKRVDPIINAKIGEAKTADTITGRLHNSPTRENQAGEVVVDGQLYEANKLGLKADFALTNTGGVRADIVVKPDKSITWGAAQAVQPFGNMLKVVEMTGQQIVDALNQQYDQNESYYLQIAGMKYIYTDNDNPDQKYKVYKVFTADGKPLEMNKTYRVVINDFLHGGGDGFSAFKNTKQVGVVGSDTDVFIQYITDMTAAGHPIAAPKLDRKQYMTLAEIAKTEKDNTTKVDESTQTDPTTKPEQKPSQKQPSNVTTPTGDVSKTKLNKDNVELMKKTSDNKEADLPKTADNVEATMGASLVAILSSIAVALKLKRKVK